MKQDTGEGISPIETHYAGCRFRSRLEARWAVFFDCLNIQWEYEAQGYELPSGARYLPDFYLPTIDVLVEVKGSESDFKNDAPRYAEALQTRSLPGRGLVILGPIPDATRRRPLHLAVVASEHCCGAMVLDLHHVDFAELLDETAERREWCLGYGLGRMSHIPAELPTPRPPGYTGAHYWGVGAALASDPNSEGLIFTGYEEWPHDPRLIHAYGAARAARFEYGRAG